jgi:hypothetical protein
VAHISGRPSGQWARLTGVPAPGLGPFPKKRGASPPRRSTKRLTDITPTQAPTATANTRACSGLPNARAHCVGVRLTEPSQLACTVNYSPARKSTPEAAD